MARRGAKTPQRNAQDPVRHSLEMLAKARVLAGSEVEESEALDAIEEANNRFTSLGATVPRYDPESLIRYVEITPHLRPCIDAMAQNIDGFGYRSKPVEPWMEDLDSEEATEAIRQALDIERWQDEQDAALDREQEKAQLRAQLEELLGKANDARAQGQTSRTVRKWERKVEEAQVQLDALETPPEEPLLPEGEVPEGEQTAEESVPDAEVDKAREMLRDELRRQGYLFEAWFKNCCSDRSFVELRRNVREDIKTHGWGGIEFLRDGYGRLKRLAYVPGYTIRPMADRGDLVDVTEDDAITPLSEGRQVMVKRRFRIYVQIVGGSKVYFKSPGDPRTISRTTGRVYRDLAAMRRPVEADPPGEGADAQTANELLYLSDHDPTTPCPPPVWIGNLVSVLGVREADETNYYYLADKALPAGMLFVHGGRLSRGVKERIESRIKNELAGAQGTGKLLVVEANPTGGNPNERSVLPSITFQSLREMHTNDALFTAYDERTADRIGASFRLSPMLRGYTPSTLNRATANAALYFAEQQVFQPERDEFDWVINKSVMPEIGLTLLRFQSKSPPTKSAEEYAKLVQATAPHGGWTPNEIRDQVSDLLNRPMAKFDEDWANAPMVLTLAGGAPGGEDLGGMDEVSASEISKRLRSIEARVSTMVTEELRAMGYDMEARSAFIGPEDGEDPSDA